MNTITTLSFVLYAALSAAQSSAGYKLKDWTTKLNMPESELFLRITDSSKVLYDSLLNKEITFFPNKANSSIEGFAYDSIVCRVISNRVVNFAFYIKADFSQSHNIAEFFKKKYHGKCTQAIKVSPNKMMCTDVLISRKKYRVKVLLILEQNQVIIHIV